MKYGKIIIEKKEYELLKQIISMSQYHNDKTYRASIEKLHNELDLAQIVSSKKMPDDVIRFDSIVTIEIPGNIQRTYEIVTPEKKDLKSNKISVLAPMGLALFGYAQGDEVEWQFPKGLSHIKILEVVQPFAPANLKNVQSENFPLEG